MLTIIPCQRNQSLMKQSTKSLFPAVHQKRKLLPKTNLTKLLVVHVSLLRTCLVPAQLGSRYCVTHLEGTDSRAPDLSLPFLVALNSKSCPQMRRRLVWMEAIGLTLRNLQLSNQALQRVWVHLGWKAKQMSRAIRICRTLHLGQPHKKRPLTWSCIQGT